MKYLLRSAMLLVFALSMITVSNAQSREAVPNEELSELSASLELSPEQSTQVEQLQIKFAEKKKGIATTTPNADEASAKLKELKASYLKEFAAILSPEQLEKWRAMQPQDGK